MILLPFALASAGTPEPEELPDDDVPADVLVRDLPLARYPKDDADAWFGVTPPTFGWAPDFGASLGLELNARVSTRLAWLQPELRLQLGDAAAHGGLGQADLAARAAEVARGGDREEDLQLAQGDIHEKES